MALIPTFIDISETEQCEELREFFETLATGDQQLPPKSADINQELKHVISGCALVLREPSEGQPLVKESDVECVLNSVVSLLLVSSPQNAELIPLFCQQLLKSCRSPRSASICTRILRNLFVGLGDLHDLRLHVYLSLVRLAAVTGHVQSVYEDVSKLRQWFPRQHVAVERLQLLLRALHEALVKHALTSEASHVMIELLSTYTEENASQARDEAHKCIVACLQDEKTFLMDHLLSLKPVKFLEGEPIHDLLTIFVADKLHNYIKFYNARKEFVESLGLSHEQNLQKMRLLTFMQMAETKKEIPFEAIQSDLQLNADQVEAFVIDVVRTRLVKAKVDQTAQRVLVSSTMHRTFGRAQWQQLRDTLSTYSKNLAHVQHTIAAALHAN